MKKVLILEDDSIQGFLVSNMLKSNGYDITYFDNYESAIDNIKDNQYDFYLVDINLEYEKTGIDFVEKIRKLVKAPIIITSNFHIGIDLHKRVSEMLGFNLFELDQQFESNNIYFFMKPIVYDRLIKKMNELI